jgi:hypothetical protein
MDCFRLGPSYSARRKNRFNGELLVRAGGLDLGVSKRKQGEKDQERKAAHNHSGQQAVTANQ